MLIAEMYGTQIPAPLHTHSSMHLVSCPPPLSLTGCSVMRTFSHCWLSLHLQRSIPSVCSWDLALSTTSYMTSTVVSLPKHTHTIVFILCESVERITYLCYCHDLHVLYVLWMRLVCGTAGGKENFGLQRFEVTQLVRQSTSSLCLLKFLPRCCFCYCVCCYS